MDINELYTSIPDELQGNISVMSNKITMTWPDGKGAITWELVDGKELKNFDKVVCETAAKISLK